MKRAFLAASLGGLICLGAASAQAHDEGCDYRDGVTAVERGYDADVVHYDHHHSGYDEDGNPYVAHHDHHYVVPNQDYGYQQQYYRSGYGQQRYYRGHRRHRARLSFFFNG